MRLSFLQGFNQGLSGILRAQTNTYSTQAQIASGKRVMTAADDPVAAARIIQIDQDQSQLGQFIKNAGSLENRLTLEESQLKGVTELLTRVREQTVYAANGVLSENERRIIAVEIEGRLDELVNLANTRDNNGEFIFAGFKGGSEPFVQNTAGDYQYLGDEGQRLISIASNTKLPANDSGKEIFVDIPAEQTMFFTSNGLANTGSASISHGRVVDAAAFASSDPMGYTVTYDATGPQYSVLGNSPGAVATLVPDDGSGHIDINGFSVTISGTADDGDTFNVESSSAPKQDMMTTLSKLARSLNTLGTSGEDQEAYRLAMADALNNLDGALENINQINAKIGARFNTLESVREVMESVSQVNSEVLAEIRDLDYAEAVSRLTMESFTLEAAQQSYAKVNGISLFNFLR